MTGPEAARNSPLDGLPVVPHVIRAWRVFVVDANRLRSVHFYGPGYGWWQVGEWHRARCPNSDGSPPSTTTFGMLSAQHMLHGGLARHAAPHAACSCGIYATTLEQIVDWLITTQPAAVARVELAGRIIECEQGYRAEYARIVRYWPGWYWAERMARTVFARDLSWQWQRWRAVRSRCRHCGMPYDPTNGRPPLCFMHASVRWCSSCERLIESSDSAGCWWRDRWPHLVQRVA